MRGQTIVVGALWVLAGLLCILSVLLLREYYFYRAQSAQLLELKDAYRQQMGDLEKFKLERRTKEEMAAGDEPLDKKKSSDDDELNAPEFPLGVRIVSSDDTSDDDQGTFLILKRDAAYLRQSAIDYLREHQCDCAIYDDSYYQKQPNKKNQNVRTSHRKTRKNSRKKLASHVAEPEYTSFEQEGIRERVLSWPIDGRGKQFWLSSLYGPRRHNGRWTLHGGVDMAAARGTPVHAAGVGVVLEARYDSGFGKTILIEHNHKYKTRYAHLDTILVSSGQHVTRQTVIGRVGRTGNVRSRYGDPSHLHFEVYAFGKKINPLYVLGV